MRPVHRSSRHHFLECILLAFALLIGACTAPPTTPVDNDSPPDVTDDSVDETIDDDDLAEPGPPVLDDPICLTGAFICTEDLDSTDCGEWELEIHETNAVVGTGTITGTLGSIAVTLTGLFDSNTATIYIDITGDDGGLGSMTLANFNPDIQVGGDWTYSTATTPDAASANGVATGTSCSAASPS